MKQRSMRRVFRAAAAATLFTTVLGPPAAHAGPSCSGLSPTIIGTEGDDLLVGTGRADVIVGLGGDDVIRSRGGDDVICAGPGDDQIRPGGGADLVWGGAGSDTVSYAGAPAGVMVDLAAGRASGGDGDDGLDDLEIIVGSRHADVLAGDGAANRINGRGGDDVILGRGGADLLDGGRGGDVLEGGPGDDTLLGRAGADTAAYAAAGGGVTVDLRRGLAEGHGTDVLHLVESVVGGPGDDDMTGNARANRFYGGPGADRLRGRSGADEMVGGADRDVTLGGAGEDHCDGERSRRCELAAGWIHADASGVGGAVLGTDFDTALDELLATFRVPDADSGWVGPVSEFGTCPGAAVRGMRWAGLLVLFVDGAMFSYELEAPEPNDLHTAAGLELGATRVELEARYGERVAFEAVAGPAATEHRFFVGRPAGEGAGWAGLSGLLSGGGPADRVALLRAGGWCER